MKISKVYLGAFQRIRRDEPNDASEQRADLWRRIRREHNLPDDVKFKVELDGPLAGELRASGTSVPWMGATSSSEVGFTVYVWRTDAGLHTHLVYDSEDHPAHIPQIALAFSDSL